MVGEEAACLDGHAVVARTKHEAPAEDIDHGGVVGARVGGAVDVEFELLVASDGVGVGLLSD